jgi:CcmD family protein
MEMDANGRIYVVVAVLAVIMAGLYVYLFLTDRRVKKLERELEEKIKRKDS